MNLLATILVAAGVLIGCGLCIALIGSAFYIWSGQ